MKHIAKRIYCSFFPSGRQVIKVMFHPEFTMVPVGRSMILSSIMSIYKNIISHTLRLDLYSYSNKKVYAYLPPEHPQQRSDDRGQVVLFFLRGLLVRPQLAGGLALDEIFKKKSSKKHHYFSVNKLRILFFIA